MANPRPNAYAMYDDSDDDDDTPPSHRALMFDPAVARETPRREEKVARETPRRVPDAVTQLVPIRFMDPPYVRPGEVGLETPGAEYIRRITGRAFEPTGRYPPSIPELFTMPDGYAPIRVDVRPSIAPRADAYAAGMEILAAQGK